MGSIGAQRIGSGETTVESIPESLVSISSYAYEGAYAKKPRGTGSWFFFPDRGREDFDNAIQVYGSYTEAKKKAIKEAARRGISTLYVGT